MSDRDEYLDAMRGMWAEMKAVNASVKTLRADVVAMGESLGARIDATNARLDAMGEFLGSRIDATNERLDTMNERLDRVGLGHLDRKRLQRLERRVDALERRDR